MIRKVLIIFVYILIITSLSAVIIGAYLLLGKSINDALVVFCAAIIISVLLIGIRLFIIRYRAKKQVERILHEENARPLSADDSAKKSSLKAMRDSWRAAIKALQTSQLKHRGQAVYVLPWYIVFGKASSGKSVSLRSAKLITPKIELAEHNEGSTQNLDWWLYDEAIVIDTSGRYAVPVNEKVDRSEWTSFLRTLARHKQKEPLSGLVLVISADRLLNNNEKELLEEGRYIRSSLTDLMKNLEIKPPVYLMVTKCDLIPGFSEWCQYMPLQSLRQPMGYLNETDGGSLDENIDDALNSILSRMKELRLLMLERSSNKGDCLLTLPVEMEKLRTGLHTFASTSLKDNIYQETPRFRGLYLSSGQLVHNEINIEQSPHAGAFLHHFYTRILPTDRGMTDNLDASLRIRNAIKTFSISISGALTLGITLALISFYSNNLEVLDKLKTSYGHIKVNQDLVNAEVSQLTRLRELIIALDNAQNKWVVPWTGTTKRSQQIQSLVDIYNEQFKNKILTRLDGPLKKKILSIQKEEASTLAGGVVRRINMLKIRLSNDSTVSLEKQPNISGDYVIKLDPTMTDESAENFNDLYKSYLMWSRSPVELDEERAKLQLALVDLLQKNQGDYEWIIDWAENQGGEPVTLKDFWGGNLTLTEDEPFVPFAYTLDGREVILEFMQELRQASGNNANLTRIMTDFDEFYERKYVRSWIEFAKRFDDGQKTLEGRKEWLSMVERMSTDGNPYFMLLERLHTELQPLAHVQDFMSKDMVDYLADVKGYDTQGDSTGGKNNSKLVLNAISAVGKAGKSTARAGRNILKAKNNINNGKSQEQLESIIADAAKAFDQYKSSLVSVAFSADSRVNSMNATAVLFNKPDDYGTGDGPVADAEKAVLNLEKLIGKPNYESQIFWYLYTGPIRVTQEYMREETSCNLQDLWEKNVLAELEGVANNKVSNALIGDGGLVWKYIETSAQPFLSKRQLRGYQPTQANGMAIPWTEEFISFVNNGSVGKNIVNGEYTVHIGSLPTGVNQTAQLSPYSTILSLKCAGGVQTLANYNYNSSKDFTWSLEKCGDVSLSISVGQITLRKDYKGEKGFPQFLKDFRDGHKVFEVAQEFPEYVQQLNNVNVHAIDVNYEITGEGPLIDILDTAPLNAPQKVAACWQ